VQATLPGSFAGPWVIIESDSCEYCFHTVGERTRTAVEGEPRSQLEQQRPPSCPCSTESQRQTKNIEITNGGKHTLKKTWHLRLYSTSVHTGMTWTL